MINKQIKVVFTEEAQAFMDKIPDEAFKKLSFNIAKVSNYIIDINIFKKLENSNIWEFRAIANRIAYRLFAFWDNEEKTLIIATHGIVKKTQKTPSKEIKKAEAIRKLYFESKKL